MAEVLMTSDRIRDFLSAAGRRGFVWGQHDCMMFAADWAKALTGRDPAEGWRGAYDDARGAAAIIEAAGGPAPHIDATLGRTGWSRVDPCAAKAGDIVLSALPGHSGLLCGIRLLVASAFLSRRGLVIWRVEPVAAWRAEQGGAHG